MYIGDIRGGFDRADGDMHLAQTEWQHDVVATGPQGVWQWVRKYFQIMKFKIFSDSLGWDKCKYWSKYDKEFPKLASVDSYLWLLTVDLTWRRRQECKEPRFRYTYIKKRDSQNVSKYSNLFLNYWSGMEKTIQITQRSEGKILNIRDSQVYAKVEKLKSWKVEKRCFMRATNFNGWGRSARRWKMLCWVFIATWSWIITRLGYKRSALTSDLNYSCEERFSILS